MGDFGVFARSVGLPPLPFHEGLERMSAWLHALTAQLSAHPEWALFAIFGGSLLEAAAIIGTFVPGSAIVFAGGALIGVGAISPGSAFAAAVLGAVLGDGFSFWLGRSYGARLPSTWPLNAHPDMLVRAQTYFARHGGKSVFLGRFLSPTRAVVPLVAGISRMPVAEFYRMNVLSALAWAALHLMPGALFGASIDRAGAFTARIGIVVLAAALLLWAFAWSVVKLSAFVLPSADDLRAGWTRRALSRHDRASRFIASFLDPAGPASTGMLLAAMAALLIGLGTFLAILQQVLSGGPLTVLDGAVFHALQRLRTVRVDHLMVAVTEVGGAGVAMPVVVAVAAALAWRRHWCALGFWLMAIGGEQAMVWALKATVARTRPSAIYEGFERFSFPSGHTARSIVLYGVLAFLLTHASRGNASERGRQLWARAVIGSSAVLVLLISFSRLYLGAHWLSDVLASLSLGMAWIALLVMGYPWQQDANAPRISRRSLTLAALIALAAAGPIYVSIHHDKDMARYAPRARSVGLHVADAPVDHAAPETFLRRS